MASNDGLSWDLTLSESGQPADDEPSYATAAVGDFAPVEVRPSPDAFLSCVDGRAREAEEDGVAQLDLAWQYELRTPAAAGTGGPDDDLSSAVKAFEVGALRAVAGDLALSRCEYLGGRRRRHARRRRGLRKDGARVAAAAAPRASNDAPGSGVAGVGSYPHDTEDTDHGEFRMPREGRSAPALPRSSCRDTGTEVTLKSGGDKQRSACANLLFGRPRGSVLGEGCVRQGQGIRGGPRCAASTAVHGANEAPPRRSRARAKSRPQ